MIRDVLRMGDARLLERSRDVADPTAPAIAAGIVATTSIQAIFSSAVWIDLRLTDRNQAKTKCTISSQK